MKELCETMNIEALILRVKRFLATHQEYDIAFFPNHERLFYHIQIYHSGKVVDRITDIDLKTAWFKTVTTLESRVSL